MFSEYVRQYFISRITPHWSEIRDWSYRIEKLEKRIQQLEEEKVITGNESSQPKVFTGSENN